MGEFMQSVVRKNYKERTQKNVRHNKIIGVL
jgi:hypothetical protein